MQVAGIVGAALVGLVAVIGVVFVVGMRRKSRVVLDAVRRAGRLTKGLVLRTAGSAGSSTAVVRHVGRSSGRRYETPVVAVRSAGGFAIALPYGMNTDWLKTWSRAAGRRSRSTATPGRSTSPRSSPSRR